MDFMTTMQTEKLTESSPPAFTPASPDAEQVLQAAARALADRKGQQLSVLDLTGITTVARYFLIATGTSTTHIKALADSVEDSLGKRGLHPFRRNGYASARWILLDYSDVVVHVFHEQERDFYGLERLWQDARPVSPAGLLSADG